MSPHDSSEDPEVSLTKYIKKLENLQERISTGSRRGRAKYWIIYVFLMVGREGVVGGVEESEIL